MAQLRHRALLEMNHVIHSGSLRIFPRRLDYLAVNIVALNLHFSILADHILCLFHDTVPFFFRNQVVPFFGQKFAV